MCIQQNIFFRNIRTKTQRLDTNTEPPSKRRHINITQNNRIRQSGKWVLAWRC